jgi:predicted membrane channel-forming protein YqfA (hemolysin III family)
VGAITIGSGKIFLDAAASELSELSQLNRANTASYRLRETIMRYFEFARIPVLIIGLITAFGCLIDWRAAMLNPAYVLGIAMWALAASRIFVIALLDATFVPSSNPVYLAPAGFAATAGAILSIAAWMQLRNSAAALRQNPRAAA